LAENRLQEQNTDERLKRAGYLRIDQGNGTVLTTGDNVSVKSTPCGGGDLGTLGVEVVDGLGRDYFQQNRIISERNQNIERNKKRIPAAILNNIPVSVTPFSTLKIWRVAGKPIRGSVTKRTNLSSSENWTHLTAVLNSHDFKHFPLETSQSLAVLSADPETKRVLEAKRL
jgi:hypothetical protein